MHWIFLLSLSIALAAAEQSGYNYNSVSAPIQQNYASAPAPAQHYEELNKEFYHFTAPEEEFAVPQYQAAPSVTKKNLQVIFIRAPEQVGLNHALQNIAHETLEQQTAIYVLTKQPDISQLTNVIQHESNHISHRPEVHFVKYRTHEDAARAQQSIRAQYDALGGSSSNTGESVAPVLNFASQEQQQHHQGSIGGGHSSVSQTYLPSRR